MEFGNFFNKLRIRSGLTLRKFCEVIEEDPANISRLERGLIRAPKSPKKLKFYADSLGLEPNSDEFNQFMELGEISNKTYGIDHIENEELLQKLPVFLRTLNNKGLDEKKLDDLIKSIREDW